MDICICVYVYVCVDIDIDIVGESEYNRFPKVPPALRPPILRDIPCYLSSMGLPRPLVHSIGICKPGCTALSAGTCLSQCDHPVPVSSQWFLTKRYILLPSPVGSCRCHSISNSCVVFQSAVMAWLI